MDEGNHSLNFLNLNFENLLEEVIWLFAPKNVEVRFLQYFLQFKRRPTIILLYLQRDTLPQGLMLAKKHASQVRQYVNHHYLTKSVKNKRAREIFRFSGVLHVCLIPACL